MFFNGIILLALHFLNVQALEVVSPAKGETVVAGRTFAVEWINSGGNTEYAIDLFRASPDSHAQCGTFVTMLCGHGDRCMDSSGDYDVIFPESLQQSPSSGYVVGVKGTLDATYGCSDEFSIFTEEQVPRTNEYSLNITAPVDGDVAFVGHEYTVQWDYLNGVGSSADRFDIDLYRATGKSGQCGTYAEALCEKSMIGCRDSDGAYLIQIPPDATPDRYRIRVGRFEDESIYDCSGVFAIVDDDEFEEQYSMSYSMEFSLSYNDLSYYV